MEATLMKLLGVISTSALLLLLGAAVPAYAQEEHHEQEAKPEKQEQKAKPEKQEQKAQPAKQEQQAKPAKQQEEAKTSKQQEQQAKPVKQQEEAKTSKQQEQAKPETQAQAGKQDTQDKNVKQEEAKKSGGQQHVQHSAEEEKRHRSEPALRLSVRGGGRIPDERFHANFGREHNFRIGTPVLVGGYSRFQYSGFWFGFIEPWPVEWYYTDDVYVDYIDGGYYLINPSYPEARISISVVL